MPQSLAGIFVHIVFSTKHRLPFIDDHIADELHAYLGGVCNALKCPSIKVGGYYDHVHILCSLSRTIALMDLLEEVKKRSSKWMKTKGADYASFYWQDGYGAFSVNQSGLAAVSAYIANQKAHHSQWTYQDECRGLYRQHGMAWDERYVWD